MGKIALALGILLLATNGAQAQLTVTDKAILRTGKLKLEIHYPQTGRAEIDKRFAKQAQDFAADGDLNDTSEGANSGSMSYRIKRNDAQMFSVEVETGSYYAGHAHPMPDINTYNFLMPEAAQAGLSDFVTGQQGLERVRDLAVADLNRQLQWSFNGTSWPPARTIVGVVKDVRELGAGRAEEPQPPFLRAAVRAFVRQHDAVLVGLGFERGDEAGAVTGDAVGTDIVL